MRPTKEMLDSVLEYDGTTGSFYYKRSRADYEYPRYRVVRTGSGTYSAHVLAWIMTYGAIPAGFVVHHRDGNGKNNSIENLELLTQAENCRRQTRKKLGTTGIRNVYRDKNDGAFYARVSVRGNRHNLGRFATKEAAAEAVAEFNKST